MEKTKKAQESPEAQTHLGSNGNGINHHQHHQQGGIPKGKEPQQGQKLDHTRTPQRIPPPTASMGMGMNTTAGSGKRKAGAMTSGIQPTSSPLKRAKAGNGMIPMRRGLDEEEVSEDDIDGLGEDD